MPKRFKITAAADTATIYVYEEIGEWGVSGKAFADQMTGLSGKTNINVRINSPGGDVFDGLAIYNLLRGHGGNVTVDVDGWAASAASVIAMAGDTINMASNSFLLIHPPWTISGGNAADFRRTAEQLEAVESKLVDTYSGRRGINRELVAEWVTAETMFSADEAVDVGLADSITTESAIAAHADFSACKWLSPGMRTQVPRAAAKAIIAAKHRERLTHLALYGQ